MGKELSSEQLVYRLRSKGARLDNSASRLTLDVSHARDLGNKSWGHIEALRILGVAVIGINDYQRKNAPREVKDYQLHPRDVVVTTSIKKWHSNADLVRQTTDYNGHKSFICSEFVQLDQINEMQTKFNNHVYTKTDEERKTLKKIKANLTYSFNNETVLQWNVDNDTPLMPKNKKQLSHKQRKHGSKS